MKKEVDISMNREKHVKNEFLCWMWIVNNVDCKRLFQPISWEVKQKQKEKVKVLGITVIQTLSSSPSPPKPSEMSLTPAARGSHSHDRKASQCFQEGQMKTMVKMKLESSFHNFNLDF